MRLTSREETAAAVLRPTATESAVLGFLADGRKPIEEIADVLPGHFDGDHAARRDLLARLAELGWIEPVGYRLTEAGRRVTP